MDSLLVLLVVLLAARVCGEVSHRLGQPAMVGEVVSGVLLAAAVGWLEGPVPRLVDFGNGELFRVVLDLAIFFLMLAAGIEMRPEEVTARSRSAIAVAAGGIVLPLALGIALGWWALPDGPLKAGQALFVGVALSITAVPATIGTLMDLGRLHSPVGRMIVSAAIFDDVLGLVLLALLTAVIGTGELPGAAHILLIAGQVIAFVLIVSSIGTWVFPRVEPWIKGLRAPEAEFGALIALSLAYAVVAELLGLHFILGAFAAGLYFGRTTLGAETYERIKDRVAAFTGAFLGPIFFASIGFRVDPAALTAIPLFTAALIAAGLVGKFVGAGAPAYVYGASVREAAAVGAGMNARGAVELIVADIALRAGLFAVPAGSALIGHLFSAVVVMAVVTTIVGPMLLRALLPPVQPSLLERQD